MLAAGCLLLELPCGPETRYQPTVELLAALPESVERVAVLDRTKEPGSIGEPLYEDICAAYINESDRPAIYAGRYGLSSKDTTPAQIKAVFDNLLLAIRQAGQLRIDHVDKSLEELGKIAEPQITKDAIAGRIRRLLQLAEKTEKARAAEGK